MILRVVSKRGEVLKEEVASVVLPAAGGRMEVLPLHAPMIAFLERGKVVYGGESLEVAGGVAKIFNDEILVLMEM